MGKCASLNRRSISSCGGTRCAPGAHLARVPGARLPKRSLRAGPQHENARPSVGSALRTHRRVAGRAASSSGDRREAGSDVISGDFTQRARRSQFAAARAFVDCCSCEHWSCPATTTSRCSISSNALRAADALPAIHIRRLEPEYEDDEMIDRREHRARVGVPVWRGPHQRPTGRANRAAVGSCCAGENARDRHASPVSGVHERRLLGRSAGRWRASGQVNADLFLSGHLHISHVSHTVDRYEAAALRADRPGRHRLDARPRRAAVIQRAADAAAGSSCSATRRIRPPRVSPPRPSAATGIRVAVGALHQPAPVVIGAWHR